MSAYRSRGQVITLVAISLTTLNLSPVRFNGSNTDLSGSVYAPSAQLNYNGSYDNDAVLVAAHGNLNGSTGEDCVSPPPGAAALTQQAILAQ